MKTDDELAQIILNTYSYGINSTSHNDRIVSNGCSEYVDRIRTTIRLHTYHNILTPEVLVELKDTFRYVNLTIQRNGSTSLSKALDTHINLIKFDEML